MATMVRPQVRIQRRSTRSCQRPSTTSHARPCPHGCCRMPGRGLLSSPWTALASCAIEGRTSTPVLHRPCFTACARHFAGCSKLCESSRFACKIAFQSAKRSHHKGRAARGLEKCYNASSPKSWFSPELEPIQVKTTSTLMILGSGPLCPSLGRPGAPGQTEAQARAGGLGAPRRGLKICRQTEAQSAGLRTNRSP